MSTPNTLSAQESSTTPVMGGVQLTTNDENEASQSKNAVELDNIEEDDDTNPYGPKKRKRTSKVWMDFKVITLADGLTKAECIHCKHRLAYNKNSGVTSHLIRHSKGCVRKKVNESGQKNLSVIPTISESETVSTVHNFKYDQAKIREILSHMIVVHELPFSFPEIYSEVDAVEHIVTVRETLRNLYIEYVEAHKKNIGEKDVQSESQKESSNCTSSIVSGKTKGKVRAQFANYIKNVDSVEQVKSELEVYFEEGVVFCEDDQEFDALSWWKMNNLKFRILSKMACDVLSIPITSVASESAFSAGGRVIDPYRANLGVETAQMLLCAEDWLRARYQIKRKAKGNLELKEIHLT